MIKKRSDSLKNSVTKYKDVCIIDKEDILAMFNHKEVRTRNKFSIFK